MTLFPELRLALIGGWWYVLLYVLTLIVQPFFYKNSRQIARRLMFHPRYSVQDKIFGNVGWFLYLCTFVYSLFLPLNSRFPLFLAGNIVYALSLLASIVSTHNFASTPLDKPVTRGMYRLSRNPLHFFSVIIWIGVALITGSAILIIAAVLNFIGIHVSTLAEEKFCLEKYGQSYRQYMKQVHRYLLFF